MAHQRKSKSTRATRESVTGKPATGHDRKKTDMPSEPNSITQHAQAETTRADEASAPGSGGAIHRFASAIRGLFGRKTAGEDPEMPIASIPEAATATPARKARPTRREADIPMDVLANTYTPNQTSLKGGFRDNGSDRHKDQEFATGAGDTGWNDEDHYTNKSNDPRIGTHGRTYEPGEAREDVRK